MNVAVKCSSAILELDDSRMESILFDDIESGLYVDFHQNTLQFLINSGYLNSVMAEVASEMRSCWGRIDRFGADRHGIRTSSKWLNLFEMGDRLIDLIDKTHGPISNEYYWWR